MCVLKYDFPYHYARLLCLIYILLYILFDSEVEKFIAIYRFEKPTKARKMESYKFFPEISTRNRGRYSLYRQYTRITQYFLFFIYVYCRIVQLIFFTMSHRLTAQILITISILSGVHANVTGVVNSGFRTLALQVGGLL